MSWHGAWGKPDPFKRPVTPGETIGTWIVVREGTLHPHYGVQIVCRCVHCGAERTLVQTRLRHAVRRDGAKRHRGCSQKAAA